MKLNNKSKYSNSYKESDYRIKTKQKPYPIINKRLIITKSVKVIPLGGLEEVGKNMTLIEYGNDIVIIDCGLAFPDHEMLGVDIVIPDFSYVVENKDKIRGVVVTHGHEDHIGSLAYLYKAIGSIPIYGTKLTIGLIEGKLKEHKVLDQKNLCVVRPGDKVELGLIDVEFISVNHSIPDACGLAITTPAGIIVHTGDFKIDYTPINGKVIDLSRFAELGDLGVLALLSDSTNSEHPGMTVSERKIGNSFEILFKRAHERRIIIATFASNIHRIQQIMDLAVTTGRKVAVSGRSMETVVSKAFELGYLNVPHNTLINIDQIKNFSDDRLIIITTGSQGEPMSALKRMSTGDHKKVSITPNDFIIISANPIPGNEKFVSKVVNELMKLGAQVIYEDMYDVHVSGHAFQNEQKLIINLVKPQYFLPVHGEYKHLKRHAETAISMGINPSNVHIGNNGEIIELSSKKMMVVNRVQAGNVMVDGLGIGDVGNSVLKDRKHLAEDGLVVIAVAVDKDSYNIVAGPDIFTRGFIYVKESEDVVNKIRNIAIKVFNKHISYNNKNWNSVKIKLRDDISDYLYSRIKRNPMILTVIQEVSC